MIKEEEILTLEEEVKKELDERKKKAKEMSHLMRKREKRELKQNSLFFSYIDDARKELEEGLDFLQRAEKQPQLLFTSSEEYLKPRGMMMAIMNHWRNDKEYVKGHDFQVYLAHVANIYFQEWLRNKGINESFTLEVRNPNQFPSIFAVYHDDKEILQCNLQKKWYGVRKRPLTEEKILAKHKKDIEHIEGIIKEEEENLQTAILRRDKPLQYYKGVKNFIQYLFINKQKLYDSFTRDVKKIESTIHHFRKEKEMMIQSLPEITKENEEKSALIQQVEPFFVQLGYELNTNESSLY